MLRPEREGALGYRNNVFILIKGLQSCSALGGGGGGEKPGAMYWVHCR